jgi:serine phosphatase RsbU (regulator of sigma subunit)
MIWPDFQEFHATTTTTGNHRTQAGRAARIRLSTDLLNGRYSQGERLRLTEIARDYDLDPGSALGLLADLHALGMVTLAGPDGAIVRSLDPKEMHEAYEIRAALEEIGGRAAAQLLKGKTADLQREQEIMRTAVRNLDLEAYAEHDVIFHRTILEISGNDVLLRVWDSMAFDIRIRAAIGKVAGDLVEVVESHQPIIDALERGQGKEAGLLLRNHVETFLQFLKKAELDPLFLDRNLEIARDVQQAFIPQQPPSIPGLSCDAFYRPAQGIGGDYYDFLQLEGQRWGIAIGDVSGKGIGAALVMASLQASVRAQALHTHLDPAALIGHVNSLVHESSPVHFFASLFYAEYEPASRVLTYVNAGQNPPIVSRCRNGESHVFRLQPGGAPVGLFADSSYHSASFQLEEGDILVACTDGIIEAENGEGEPWGQQRLENLFTSCQRQSPTQVVQQIVHEVSVFTAGGPQKDDITLVVVQVQDLAGLHS